MGKTAQELAVELTIASLDRLMPSSKEDVTEIFNTYYKTIKDAVASSNEGSTVHTRPQIR